jgi:hypothetical protein
LLDDNGTITDLTPGIGDGDGDGTVTTDPEDDESLYDIVIGKKEDGTYEDRSYIEDLLDAAMYTSDGKKVLLVLKNDLDFTNPEDYREPYHYYMNPVTEKRMSLDSLTTVTTDGGKNGENADNSNDSYPTTSNVFEELSSNRTWMPGFVQIGSTSDNAFKGTINGKGHTIKDFYMSDYLNYSSTSVSSQKSIIGFIGYNEGIIKNLNIKGYKIAVNTNYGDAGVLVGYNKSSGIIKNCTVNSDDAINILERRLCC